MCVTNEAQVVEYSVSRVAAAGVKLKATNGRERQEVIRLNELQKTDGGEF